MLGGVVAANINERHVYYGNSPLVETPAEKAMRVKELAEELEAQRPATRRGVGTEYDIKNVAILMKRKLFHSFYPMFNQAKSFLNGTILRLDINYR